MLASFTTAIERTPGAIPTGGSPLFLQGKKQGARENTIVSNLHPHERADLIFDLPSQSRVQIV
jgi:hypothetical protein